MTLQDDSIRCEGYNAAESSAKIAHSALEHWRWAVRGVPFTASSDEARIALRGLAAWYERICVDDAYDNPAPADGLDSLMAQEREPDHLFLRRDVMSHWAVRDAEELAEWRRRDQPVTAIQPPRFWLTPSSISPFGVRSTSCADPCLREWPPEGSDEHSLP